MSLYLRYAILTLVFLGLAIAFFLSPAFTGLVTKENHLPVINCEESSDYYDCIRCCQNKADVVGKEYYGTSAWNDVYNSCWSEYCVIHSN